MKWVLLVVILTPSGDLDKAMNGGPGWENRSDCRAYIEKAYNEIHQSVVDHYKGYTENSQILGFGCFQPLTNQEDIVIVLNNG